MDLNQLDKIKCPICGVFLKSLNSHIVHIHKMTLTQFKELYPNYPIHVDSRKKLKLECQYCGKKFSLKNGLQLHIKKLHPQHYCKLTGEGSDGHLQCKICGKKTDVLYNHISLKHNISWQQYCQEYGQSAKAFFTQKHIKSLSQNKKIFYQSDRGYQLKLKQRQMYSGQNNPAKRRQARSKISAAAAKRIARGDIKYNRMGINIHFEMDGQLYNVRSFQQFKTVYTLIKNNVQFEYQKRIVNYQDQNGIVRHYILDFTINGDPVQLKCDTKKVDYLSIFKYKTVSDILAKLGEQFSVLSYQQICDRYGLIKPLSSQFYDTLKYLLKDNKCSITYVCRQNSKSRILSRIDQNYENNQNIKIIRVVKQESKDEIV